MAGQLKMSENVAQNPNFEAIFLKTRYFVIHIMVIYHHKTIFLVSLALCKGLLVFFPKIYDSKHEHFF